MKVTGFNHLSIGSKNLAESVEFYETVLGMETIPSYNFGFKTKYLRCGDLQLHVFELAHVPAKWDPVRRLKPLTAFAVQNAEGLNASLYLDRPHLKKSAHRAGA